MGLRFRRSISLFPGARWNVGLKNYSVSLGIRGARYTTGTRGRRVTIGLPGIGFSFTQQVGPPRRAFRTHTFFCVLALLIVFALGLALITLFVGSSSIRGNSSGPPDQLSSVTDGTFTLGRFAVAARDEDVSNG
jgi:hypothetical protein